MSIEKRLRRLENGRTASLACEVCGFDGDLTGATYEVVWDGLGSLEDHHEGAASEPTEPERCGACGRQTEFIVTWPDESGGAA